ncbi:MAG TPA: 16S rRNA (cytidine(1402)-2'-O)-methyltransferase [Gammaproteobacteria bacterium]|nr:16S rRNA (cytidine(1402)-2'-O)-methyltransferase [Gammaproteobacteria bacterium]
MKNAEAGVLYVVATPIGNLQDMSLRGVEILQQVDRIAAEDTRHAIPLLKHFLINKPMLSLHDFNERDRSAALLHYIQAGESIALISDAGTPLISDPGFHLVREAHAQGVRVVPIPGACAAIAALSAAGLPSDRFTFEGFLPAKAESCKNRLLSLLHEPRTMIFYEAPHRLLAVLQMMHEVFGNRKAVVARELTKIYESVMLNDLSELVAFYEKHTDKQRGEVVLVVSGGVEETGETKEVRAEDVLRILLADLPLKQAVSLAAQITGCRKNLLYEMALKMANNA